MAATWASAGRPASRSCGSPLPRIPTPGGGRVSLKVPAGSQDGRKLRVRGKGMPKLKGGQGDLLVQLRVLIPGKLTRDQKQLFEKLAATFPDPRSTAE